MWKRGRFCVLFLFVKVPILLFSQQVGNTAEDSVSQGSTSQVETSVGGYGNMIYQNDLSNSQSLIDLERVVLFVGHRFNSTISFFSELEVEDAKVSGGEEGGEIAYEQAYVRFDLDRSHHLVAGLFLPRVGIMNEDHLPTSFNGNERTQVETWVLPSTWRELGIGYYGSLNSFPLSYGLALVNGLNSATFQHGSGIREGRFEGRNATAKNLALTGSVQWNQANVRGQISGYYGGTVGLSSEAADSLGLKGGAFGTPVLIGEADVQYETNGFRFRGLGAVISIPDAFDINRAYGNNTPNTEFGFYAEASYDVLRALCSETTQSLPFFLRWERLNLNASIPINGAPDPALDQSHLIGGICYFPDENVVVKADIRRLGTASGVRRSYLNLGIGFSF